jgi:hypothetical protein
MRAALILLVAVGQTTTVQNRIRGRSRRRGDNDEEERQFQPDKVKKSLKKLRKSKSCSLDSEQDDVDSLDNEPSLPQSKEEN